MKNPKQTAAIILITCSALGVGVFFYKRGSNTGTEDTTAVGPSGSLEEKSSSPSKGQTSSKVAGASVGKTGSAVNVSGGSVTGSAPLATTPGILPSTAKSGESAPLPEQPSPVECFAVTYHHKSAKGHKDEEDCTQHRNLVRIPHTEIHAKSLCVRVNGKPVRFKTQKDKKNGAMSIVLEAGPGPKSVISARYCLTSKAKCAEDCVIPKDEFMDAIGANEDSAPTAQWDPQDSEGADINGAVDAALRRELAGVGESDLFDGWVAGTEAPACDAKGQKVAAVRE